MDDYLEMQEKGEMALDEQMARLLAVARAAKLLARSIEIYIRDTDTGTLDLHDWTKMIQYSEYPELNTALAAAEDLL